jgi:hypothetical protein
MWVALLLHSSRQCARSRAIVFSTEGLPHRHFGADQAGLWWLWLAGWVLLNATPGLSQAECQLVSHSHPSSAAAQLGTLRLSEECGMVVLARGCGYNACSTWDSLRVYVSSRCSSQQTCLHSVLGLSSAVSAGEVMSLPLVSAATGRYCWQHC